METSKDSPYYNIYLNLIQELRKKIKAEAEPQLTTPVGIKFLATESGLVSGMYFNDGTQCLSYCGLTGQFEVHAVYRSGDGPDLWIESECLPLTPCKYKDLKPGDFFKCTTDFYLFADGNRYVSADKNSHENGAGVSSYVGLGPELIAWKVGK